jgi:hypothetical protein
MCRKLICLIGLVAVFAWSASALAVTALVDDFGSYANGQVDAVTTNWKGIIGSLGEPTNTAIVTDPCNPANKVLRFLCNGWGGTYGILSGDAIIANGTTKTLFMRLKASSTTTDASFGMTSKDVPLPNEWAVYGPQFRFLSGVIQARDGTGWGVPTLPVAADTWYHIWVVVNHTANTFKVYMNASGNTATEADRLGATSEYGFRYTPDVNAMDRFMSMTGLNGGTIDWQIWVDDMYVADGANLTAMWGKWASCPNPADNSMYGGTDVTLKWTQGRSVAKNDVYFGTDISKVTDANRTNEMSVLKSKDWDPNNYLIAGLIPSTKYYWRIDEVSSGGSPIYKGKVWSFTTKSLTAYNPSPPDGGILVDPDANLSWSPGLLAKTHDVNFGKVNPPPFIKTQAGTTYDPGTLQDSNTYYWQITEVNGVNRWTGPVWSFTTWSYIPITEPNLLGWWKFEDSNGGKTLDSSGHNRHGTLTGDPNYATGIFGQAIHLDGIDDWVSVGSVGISGAAPRTIAGWAKRNSATVTDVAYTNVFGFFAEGNTTEHTCFNIDVSGTTVANPGWYIIHILNYHWDILPPDLFWHHFAATYDGNAVRWYGDGALKGEAVPPAPAPILTTTDNVQMGKRTTNEDTFPGLIDDVRIYNKALTPEEIRQIMIPPWAWQQCPGYGDTNVPRKLTLTWKAGKYADKVAGHSVYFDPNEQKVIDRSGGCKVNVSRTEPNYTFGDLLTLDETYYWAVDEVNDACDPCGWPGDVLKFTTANYDVVEDFNSYAGNGPLRAVWTATSSTGAAISLQTGIANANLVRDGNSMQYDYDNYNWFYSEAYANTAALPSKIGSDWKVGGVKSLTLWFYGQLDNDANEQMYVKLTDSASKTAKVVYSGDMNDIRETKWHEWNIALQKFVDACSVLNLANVKTITIGFGDGIDPGYSWGPSTVYFDDIRLYIPRCIPSTVPDSASGNCLIDYPDLQILRNNWLISDYNVTPVSWDPNGDPNLVAYYKFDGDFKDSSGKGNDGNDTDPNIASIVTDPIRGQVASFDGINDYVNCSNDVSLNITGKITLAAWVKTNDCGDSNFNPYIAKGDHAYILQHRAVNDLEIAIYSAGAWYFANTPVDRSFNGVWHHLAGTYNGSQLKLYIDGELKDTTDYVGSIAIETANVNLGRSSESGGSPPFASRLYNGALDDVRIYSRALSQEQVAWLAGKRADFKQPLEPLLTPKNPGINLYKDGRIDLRDYAVLADEWLEEVLWP